MTKYEEYLKLVDSYMKAFSEFTEAYDKMRSKHIEMIDGLSHLTTDVVSNTELNEPGKMKWQKEKPDYPCIFVTRGSDKKDTFLYDVYYIDWVGDDGEEYLGLMNSSGNEWEALEDLQAAEYLVLEKLPESED